MNVQLLTKDDLKEFKGELFLEMARLLALKAPVPVTQAQWLRSYQVKELLHISAGTLQTMRIKNILPAKKIGGILFFSLKDIETLLKR